MPKAEFNRRVVITGLGVVCPIGNNAEDFWSNLLAGKSGAAPITYFDTTHFDTKFACEVKGFDPLNFMDRKLAQRVDLFTQFALASADMAVKDSGIDFAKYDPFRTGVVFGSGIGGMWTYHKGQPGPYKPVLYPDADFGYCSRQDFDEI
jgi:3-oxoacyl-[acyl-carrier-protein] synthase II